MTGLLNISAEDAEEYSQSLAKIGEGWVEQIVWAFRQGIPQAMGMSRIEWRRKYYGHLKIGDPTERETTAKELAAEGLNNSQIADALGVSEFTVRQDLKESDPEPETDSINHESDSEGQAEQQVTDPEPETDSINHESDEPLWSPEDLDGNGDVDRETEPGTSDASDTDLSLPYPVSPPVNDGDEWYTPPWLFRSLGIEFSLDVCAPLDQTYSAVPADKHLTIVDDGLAQHWHGTVWCNPPYSKPEPWARRLIHHGDGLLLTHIPMNAGWAVDVWESCDAIRLFQAMEFVRPDGTSQRPGYWLQLAAFGPVATEALGRIQPLGDAAHNKRRVASPMWRRVTT